ncbi:hypothetical protein [Ochrobactrum sp. CGA5]|uniref:hypothetical protein n=1 Tax=Ochrobactrum sp. CGA5 TaxID=2583453 RepID=UPI00111E114E|nr:hypothetical protein [Ochrobactrum sp. CGA5]
MKYLILAASLSLIAGCSSLTDAQGSCQTQYSDYSQMWDCIRGRVKSGTAGMMNNDVGMRYMAFGDNLNEKYKAGLISNSDAKLALSQELVRGNSDFNAKYKPTTCTTRPVFGTLQTSCY